jgi:hypothetical protein
MQVVIESAWMRQEGIVLTRNDKAARMPEDSAAGGTAR